MFRNILIFYFKVGGVILAISNAGQQNVFPSHGFVTQRTIVEILQMKKIAVRICEFVNFYLGRGLQAQGEGGTQHRSDIFGLEYCQN